MIWQSSLQLLWLATFIWYMADQFYFQPKRFDSLQEKTVEGILQSLKKSDQVLLIDDKNRAVVIPRNDLQV